MTERSKNLNGRPGQMDSKDQDPGSPVLTSLFKDMPFPVFVLNSEQKIIFWNEKCENLTGYKAEDILQHSSPFDMLIQDKEHRNSFLNSWLEKEHPMTCPLRIECAKGDVRVISVSRLRTAEKGEFTGCAVLIGEDLTGYQKAQVKLMADHTRYRNLFESVKSAIAVFEVVANGKDFIFVDINKYAEDLDGLKKEKVIGKSVYDVFPGVDDFGIIDVYKKVWETGHPGVHPASLYKDDKREVWRETYVYKIATGELVVMYNDYSEKMRSERQFIENERLYNLISEHSTDVVWVLDMDFVFKYVSPATIHVLGYQPHELNGRNVSEILEPGEMRDMQRILEEDLFRIEAKEYMPRHIELKVKKKDGDYIWSDITSKIVLDNKGKPFEITGTMHDITDRKKAEEQLRESEKQYHSIFEAVMDAVIVYDKDGRVREANSAACRMHGYSRKEMLELSGRELVHPDHYHKFEDFIETTSKGLSFNVEAVNKTKDGKDVAIEVRGTGYRTHGEVLCLAIDKDISQLKKAEQAQRLANLGELASSVAHEVNNPLQVVLGRAEMLLMGDMDRSEVSRGLKTIKDQCQRARSIIRQMQIVSRPGMGHIKTFNINDVLEEVIKLFEHPFSLKNIEIRRKYHPEPVMVDIDEKKMHQVFINLFRNAAEAIGERGMINVTTYIKDTLACIEVADTGCGLPDGMDGKLFDPFFTTKDEGTGLGLSICYSIIRAHKGDIKLMRRDGQRGTLAAIVLELHKEKTSKER
jgi:PAS domain S-box-containing protein